ncbi:ribonuclease P protein component [Rickettsiales endosymbiont of Stachyamoeba lipophora]|uniref:ribonuclease P protein component n=1 Tax=Rickettsiales endosymbiont of Stachyamoeba lipophora TaxID=2486578 RepID=UPI0013DE2404|nr:ribonuclease P protein component [Rickettsiales endosymbiont of Stachyamoeba lipophora]
MFKLFTVKKRIDFIKFRQVALTQMSEFFIIKFYKNEENQTQFGFVVSKKFSKKAVVRNSIKRRIKAGIADIKPPFTPCLNILLIVKNNVSNATYNSIRADLNQSFLKMQQKLNDQNIDHNTKSL